MEAPITGAPRIESLVVEVEVHKCTSRDLSTRAFVGRAALQIAIEMRGESKQPPHQFKFVCIRCSTRRCE
jgi:hypothetical protein